MILMYTSTALVDVGYYLKFFCKKEKKKRKKKGVAQDIKHAIMCKENIIN